MCERTGGRYRDLAWMGCVSRIHAFSGNVVWPEREIRTHPGEGGSPIVGGPEVKRQTVPSSRSFKSRAVSELMCITTSEIYMPEVASGSAPGIIGPRQHERLAVERFRKKNGDPCALTCRTRLQSTRLTGIVPVGSHLQGTSRNLASPARVGVRCLQYIEKKGAGFLPPREGRETGFLEVPSM